MLGKIDKDNYTYNDYCHKIFVRKKIFFVFKIFLLILIWTPLIVYYFLPISKANISSINGNPLNFNEEYIYEYTGINNKKHIWSVDTDEVKKSLLSHQYCSNANVTLTFSGIKIDIDEIKVVAKNSEEDSTLYLSNGEEMKLSAIEDNLKDPHSLEFKFIKPYINSIPLIDETKFNKKDFYVVVKNLGALDNDLIDDINRVELNESSNKFVLVSLTIDKNKYELEKDLTVHVDARHISKLLTKNVIDECINKINKNDDKYYNVLLENDSENNAIKVVPYNA